ncbi:MAG: hypothetical protein P8Q37_04080 [Porticoccaceae bacterium]|nr:hypothetical protein [Porticoccaceae bacterium]MDG1474058.1 hypothetical protein [Porticoccaceae bacterium]
MNERSILRKQLQNIVSFGPLLASMYILFYLESQNIWIPETPHRDKITLLVLIVGMAASFIIRSFLWKTSKDEANRRFEKSSENKTNRSL